jgi:D-serine deaminase-like pyridoxal phosphate-dependent protein
MKTQIRSIKPALWHEVQDVASIPSPALLIYRHRVEENLARMLAMAGGPERLRPHIKTHKMREMLQLQLALGITKFKCATLAEAEMAAQAGVPDLLLAYQPVGPTVEGIAALVKAFPRTKFSALCDDAGALGKLSKSMHRTTRATKGQRTRVVLEVLPDLDVGQHRTGVPPGDKAFKLYRLLASLPGITPGGLHAYDGHIGDSDPAARAAACEAAFAPVLAFRRQLVKAGLPVPRLVAGGTPTFPMHARNPDRECSPGTCVFWDASYASRFADMPFVPAAVVLTRVVSKPGPNRLCLDLGHKAIASEMPHPRVEFLNLEDANFITHSEEHLVVETSRAAEFNLGDCLYGVPRHICPTVALHAEAVVIENGKSAERWRVVARDRLLRRCGEK